VEVERTLGAEDGSAPETGQTGTDGGQVAGLAAFTALLGGLLVWRSRLRRAKVQRVRPVR
jgi:LPXTG-motif cell wall-anchored protein